MTTIDGSGILLINNYLDRKTGKLTWCILAPREYNKSIRLGFDIYEDFGGKLRDNATLIENSIEEMKEESADAIHLTENDIDQKFYYDFVYDTQNSKAYRTYFINVHGLSKEYMENNLKYIKQHNLKDGTYLECDNWTWFPIDNIRSASTKVKPNFYGSTEQCKFVKDLDGNDKYIAERTWNAALNIPSEIMNDVKKFYYSQVGDITSFKVIPHRSILSK